MYTEAEAKKKWCPYARIETGQLEAMSSGLASINRVFAVLKRAFGKDDPDWQWDSDTACNCIASECMAWRWSDRDDYCDWASLMPPGISPEEHEKVHGPQPARTGLCGLAGKP